MLIRFFQKDGGLKEDQDRIFNTVIALSKKNEQKKELISEILNFIRLTYWHIKCSKLFEENQFIEKLELVEIDNLYLYKLFSECNKFKRFEDLLYFTNEFFWRIFKIMKETNLPLIALNTLKTNKSKYYENIITKYLKRGKWIVEYTDDNLENIKNITKPFYHSEKKKNRKRFIRAISKYRESFKNILSQKYMNFSKKKILYILRFTYKLYLQKDLLNILKETTNKNY